MAPFVAPRLAARLAGLGADAPAELSFGNLWLFRRAHGWRLHADDGPVIAGRAYDGRPHAIPLFDPATVPDATLRVLLARHGALYPLTVREAEALRRRLPALRAQLDTPRDDADYLYPAAQLRDYPGRLLQKKRNLVSQLLAAHRVTAEPYTPALAADALRVHEAWLADKGKRPGEADDAPCREALVHAPVLGLQGFLYRADGEPAGFLLAEPLQPGVWVVRFAKGRVRFKGIAQHMFQHFAAQVLDGSAGDSGGHAGARGAAAPAPAWLNFEQDLGLANFRRTKQSYQPARLLPKWRLSHSPQDAGAPPP